MHPHIENGKGRERCPFLNPSAGEAVLQNLAAISDRMRVSGFRSEVGDVAFGLPLHREIAL
ncbi:hypothetical protein AGRA671_19940 [Agrobacterium radiobacter]|nr:Uncharacterised protein [Agrobacterium tumefaciens]